MIPEVVKLQASGKKLFDIIEAFAEVEKLVGAGEGMPNVIQALCELLVHP